MARTQTLRVEIVGDTKRFERAISDAQRSLGGFGSTAQRLNSTLTRGFLRGAQVGVAGVAAGVGFAVQRAASFEQQLSSLGSVAEANGKQMEKFRKQALKAGAETKFSALEAAQAQTELAKGGLGVAQIMKGGLKSALALAAAGEMDLAQAASTAVNGMKLFGLRGKDSMKVADGLAKAANMTTADVSDFALALSQGGSAAKAAGFGFVETTAALSALAEIGIKGSDAGTSLKAALAQLVAPTEKQQGVMKELNLEFFDADGNMKSLTDVAGMLRNRLGDLTNEQRLQAIRTVAGTDGMRALLALYEAGPTKIDRFRRELGKQGTAAEVAKRKQDNLKGSLEQLGGSVETFGIQIGSLMIPAIRRGADELTDFTNKLGRIARRDDLDLGEKLQKALDLARVEAEPWIEKLERAVRRADLPGRIADGISAATPVIAEAAGRGAVVAGKAFVEGFLAADAWGRLAAGLWLFTRMGGRPAFLKVGAQSGAAMGAGMATGVAGSGLRGKLGAMLKGWGPTLGIALGATFGPSFIKAIDEHAHPRARNGLPKTGEALSKELRNVIASVRKGGFKTLIDPKRIGLSVASLFGPDAEAKLRRFGDTAGETFDRLREAGSDAAIGRLADQARDLAREFPQASRELRKFATDIETITQPARTVREAIDRMATGSANSMKELRQGVRFNTKQIKEHLGKDTEEGKDALTRNFRAAAANIRQSMHDGKISTRQGTREIERLMVKALQTMGFSKKEALTLREGRDPFTGKAIGGKQNLTGKQRGGPIMEGAPSGDSVPAMLERGEYVLNRRAVQKVGKANLDRVNFQAAPRFQQGGIVELLHPFNDPAGHGGSNSHLHIAMLNGIVGLGRKLQSLGWLVGEHPAFGGVGGMHAPGGYHYTADAIDVNWPDPGEEASKIKALLPMLGGALGKVGGAAPKLKRVMVDGPASMLKSIVQGALDTTLAGAQSRVDSAAMSGGVEGVEGDFSGPWTEVMAAIAKGRGWNLADWKRLVQKESGGNPAARNPSSGAFGLGQFLGATADAYAKFGALSPDGSDQIRAMAKYIADRYGNPSAALAFHDRNNWYAAGGLVGSAKRGGGGLADAFGPPKKGLPASGQLGLGGALKALKTGKTRKVRRGALRGLLDGIKGIGLPKAMQRSLSDLATRSNTFGEFADRAGSLTDTGAIQEALQAELEKRQAQGRQFPDADQQRLVDQMLGRAGGKTQQEWLQDQLGALLGWRNTIVQAEQVVVAKREETSQLIERARARLEAVRERIREANKRRKGLEDQLKGVRKRLDKAREHPKRNREQIKRLRGRAKDLRGRIREVDKRQRPRERVRSALAERVIPALRDRRSALNTARGDLLGNLEGVQGLGGPSGVLAVVPPLGSVGGQLFDVQLRLSDLVTNPPRVRAEDGGAGLATRLAEQRADLAEETARGERLNRRVLEAQIPTLKDIPRLFGLQSFGGGGVIPGPRGASSIVEAHGGEVVLTPEQARAIGSGGPMMIRVVVEDGAVDPNKIRVIADGSAQAKIDRVGAQTGLALHGIRSAPGDVAGF